MDGVGSEQGKQREGAKPGEVCKGVTASQGGHRETVSSVVFWAGYPGLCF